MAEQSFMRVEEVAQELGVSKSYAYKIVQKLNQELKEKGYLTISGRVNRKYFQEKSLLQRAGKEGFIMAVYKEEKKNEHMACDLPLYGLDRRAQAIAKTRFQDKAGSTGLGA